MYRILRYVPADEAGRRSQKRYPLVVQQSIRISDHCIRSGGSHGTHAQADLRIPAGILRKNDFSGNGCLHGIHVRNVLL